MNSRTLTTATRSCVRQLSRWQMTRRCWGSSHTRPIRRQKSRGHLEVTTNKHRHMCRRNSSGSTSSIPRVIPVKERETTGNDEWHRDANAQLAGINGVRPARSHQTLNPQVRGSSPRGPTTDHRDMSRSRGQMNAVLPAAEVLCCSHADPLCRPERACPIGPTTFSSLGEGRRAVFWPPA
jgi:hypothetical protein